MSLPACCTASPALPIALSTCRPARSAGPPSPSRLHAAKMPSSAAMTTNDFIGLFVQKRKEEFTRCSSSYRFCSRFARLCGEDCGELPAAQGRLVAQHEPAAVVDHHFEVGVARIGPALEDSEHRQAAPAEVEGARGLFASRSSVAMHTNLHGARSSKCV